ncbi:ArsR/SmtB family transcription factor [Allosphingosinicella humi]
MLRSLPKRRSPNPAMVERHEEAMSSISSLAGTATLIGEPARTAMLVALMDGRALTAGELAGAAGVSAPTASAHLSRLLEAGMLALDRQGRHRYYRLANAAVAAMLEGMMALGEVLDGSAAIPRKPIVTGPRDKALRHARLCYDHLAGEIAVAMADSMIARGQLDFGEDGAAVTPQGLAFLASLGIDLVPDDGRFRSGRSVFCRPCLDWSERRPHIAGAVGSALYRAFAGQGWMRRVEGSRAVSITPSGAAGLERHFGLRLG